MTQQTALPQFVVTGDGPATLLFLHGLGGDYTNWEPQVEEFSSDFRCIAWTLPGYGASTAIDALTFPNLSNSLVQVLNSVDVDKATVVGLSMGGYLAQQFAADHGDRVDRLVLAATSAQFGRGSQSFREKYLRARRKPLDEGKTPADLAPAVVAGLLSATAQPSAVANAVASMSRISPAAYRNALDCLVTWDFVNYLDQIDVPALCLAGANDATAPVAALEALASGIPDARLEVIADCQHLMNLDRPEEFNRLVRAFLNER